MCPTFQALLQAAFIGVGATAIMDVWHLILKRAGVPVQNFAMLGRWIGHWQNGKWFHRSIAKASPVKGEIWMGWLAHYAIGISFAGLLIQVCGKCWIDSPTALPAIILGLVTVAAPLFIMQPALGAGIASTMTDAPLRNSLKSLANHFVFGIGLYLAAIAWTVMGA